MASCKEDQISRFFSRPEQFPPVFRHGIFNLGFFSGVKGSAKNIDNIVYFETCFNYVQSFQNYIVNNMINAVNIIKISMDPCIYDGVSGDLLLVKDVDNNPPDIPSDIDGPTDLDQDVEYSFSCEVGDPDKRDTLDVFFNWGDVKYTAFEGEDAEKHKITATHSWSCSHDCKIFVVTVDSHGALSCSETLNVNSLSRNKNLIKSFLLQFFERFTNRFTILQKLKLI
jgi:hypothetical protein